MSLPDFDTLKALAQQDEGALDALLEAQISALLEAATPQCRERLRGLQFRIDCEKRLSHNPIERCVRLSRMLRAHCTELGHSLNRLQEELTAQPANGEGQVISLQEWRSRKKRPT